MTPASFWLKVARPLGQQEDRAGLDAGNAARLPAFKHFADDRNVTVQESSARTNRQFIQPVHLERVTNVPGRWPFVCVQVAQRSRLNRYHSRTAVSVGKRLAELVAALYEQAVRQTSANFDLQGMELRVDAVCHRRKRRRGSLRVDDEDDSRPCVPFGSVTDGTRLASMSLVHARGCKRDAVGKSARLSLEQLRGGRQVGMIELIAVVMSGMST